MTTTDRIKYIVYKANIMDDDGNKVLAGTVVALSPKLARHYSRLGFLKPFFEEGDDGEEPVDEEEATDEDDTTPIPTRTRRLAPRPTDAEVPAGAAAKPL